MDEKNFLIIDSSSNILKIGIKIFNQKISIDYEDGFCHLENIIPLIYQLLSKLSHVSIKDIKNILVCNGPGSFTGIRIGVATAYGLYYALDSINCFGFNVFDVYNFLIKEKDSVIIPLIDAKKNRYYCSFIKENNYQFFDLSIEEILDKIKTEFIEDKIIFVGKDFNLCKEKIDITNYQYLYKLDFKAIDLINFGEYFIDTDIKKEFPEPLYIRKSEAEISLLRKIGML